MRRPTSNLTRRAFLKGAVAAVSLAAPARAGAAADVRELLYNGITLPRPWPPRRHELAAIPSRPPYLADPPPVIDVDLGRQLFVDDFLIEESSLHRQFHQASYHPASPILTPEREWERRDPYSEITGTAPSPSAMVFSDGVFFDPADKLFKMWYMAGYEVNTALAISTDGVNWWRPELDVVRGTNIVSAERRDSTTVWLDLDEEDPATRFKMAAYTLDGRRLRLYTSSDGIHWRRRHAPGPSGDRSTFFKNPFRDVWVFSLRADSTREASRFRTYVESADFGSTHWRAADPVMWTGADSLDLIRPNVGSRAELYNLDCVAYESLLLGLFTMYRGEQSEREKPNDVCLGFSRDGFHWDRSWRDPFIPVSDRQGDWNWANVQSAGGCCMVVGDRLYFYVSGRSGVPGTSMPGTCSTGLATLRRDGFASLSDAWPSAVPRRLYKQRSTMTTRPVRFSGKYLFVNAEISGELRVEILDPSGRVLEPFSERRTVPVTGDSTAHPVQWRGQESLEALVDTPVRFRFTLDRAKLYAFWVSRSKGGHSGGYVAAGGPGFSRSIDSPR